MRIVAAFLPIFALGLAACAGRTVSPAPPAPAPPRPAVTRATPPPPPVVTDPAPADTTALADLWERATRARAEGRYPQALELLATLWETAPGYRDVAGMLEEEYRAQGLDAFARGRTEEAIEWWERALRVDPEDPKTRGYLQHARTQQSKLGEIPGKASSSTP